MKIKTTCTNCRLIYNESAEDANQYGTCSSCERKIIDRLRNLPVPSLHRKSDDLTLRTAKQIRRYFAKYYGLLFVSREHARRHINKQFKVNLSPLKFSDIVRNDILEREGLRLRKEMDY